MDALTPLANATATTLASHAPGQPPVPVPAHSAAPPPNVVRLPVDPLPPLPAAVQRARLEPERASLMSREEMLNLLSLAV